MTKKQKNLLIRLIADKFEHCATMEEVQKAIEELKEMVKADQAKEDEAVLWKKYW
ncbi:MAG: hypothetical protein NC084_13105 [Bacteroides sp.]|nr:hypothetical protein [Eubacterium sp.]MCM1419665.1 hypothetical protein [Roseburia sp.]MCM1463634.1 hypothetical protein [Bacteroides sp.]